MVPFLCVFVFSWSQWGHRKHLYLSSLWFLCFNCLSSVLNRITGCWNLPGDALWAFYRFVLFFFFFLIVHYFLHVTASQYKTEFLFSDMCLCSRLEDQQHIRSNICIILGPSVQRVLKSDPMHCAFIANNISSGWGEKRLIKPSCWDVCSEESV